MDLTKQSINHVRHTAVSLIELIVVYFSVSPMVRTLGHANANAVADLERRKGRVLDYACRGLFVNPEKIVA